MKSRLEHQLKKNSQLDFMKYCYYQVYFQDTLTKRKLDNHFDNDIIQKAIDTGVIVPWKDGYFFKAYDFCKEQFGQPSAGKNPIMQDVDELKKQIEEKENELFELKLKYNSLVNDEDNIYSLF